MQNSILARGRVLVADDEPSVREALKILLGFDRYEVTEAVDGKDALTLFSRAAYDLVITDYAMPRMGGDELAVQIKRLAPAQPIIMATGHAERLAGMKQTVDAILAKPFALGELRRSIAKVLGFKE
jgi:CheY-like chemotaxis protein